MVIKIFLCHFICTSFLKVPWPTYSPTISTPDTSSSPTISIPNTPSPGEESIVDIATGNPDLFTFVEAVTAAGLVDTLSGEGPFTVFGTYNAMAYAHIHAHHSDLFVTFILEHHSPYQ